MSIEARQIQETLYSYAAILNFTPSPQRLRAKIWRMGRTKCPAVVTMLLEHELTIVDEKSLLIVVNND